MEIGFQVTRGGEEVAGGSSCHHPVAIAARLGWDSTVIAEPAAGPAESRLMAAGRKSLPAGSHRLCLAR